MKTYFILLFSLLLLAFNVDYAPSVQAYDIITETPNNQGGGAVGFCFKRGDGEFRIVVVNPYHEVDFVPQDGPYSYYDGAGGYQRGQDLGNGNKLVWLYFDEGEGSQICDFITEIPNAPVYVRIFEFNYDFENEYAYYLASTANNNPTILN
jgi:hypothetical protein